MLVNHCAETGRGKASVGPAELEPKEGDGSEAQLDRLVVPVAVEVGDPEVQAAVAVEEGHDEVGDAASAGSLYPGSHSDLVHGDWVGDWEKGQSRTRDGRGVRWWWRQRAAIGRWRWRWR